MHEILDIHLCSSLHIGLTLRVDNYKTSTFFFALRWKAKDKRVFLGCSGRVCTREALLAESSA